MPNLNVYNMGVAGVNVDKSPLQLEDGELTKSQNAVPAPTGTTEGLLCKRLGLVKYDSDVAAGSIPGFISAPLGPGPAGATATNDLATYYVPAGDGTWLRSTNGLSTQSAVTTLAAHKNFSYPVMHRGRLFYISTAETVRVFDGVKDSLFYDPHSTHPTLTQLASTGGQLYVIAQSSAPSDYVIQLDENGRGTQIGAAIPDNYGVSNLIYHQNDLFLGTAKASSQFRIYRIRLSTQTEATSWTQDYESSGLTDPTAIYLASYKSLLYVGHSSSALGTSNVYQRSTAASYSAVETAGVANSDVTGMAVFKNTLYVAWTNFGASDAFIVRKTTDGTSWSDSLNDPASAPAATGSLFPLGNKLFMVVDGETAEGGYYTVDGTTWTEIDFTSAVQEGIGSFKTSGTGTGAAAGNLASFITLQGGTSLQILNAAGEMVTLSLPTGITLDASRPPRWALFDRYVVMANTPSRPITIDADGQVRVLTPLPPNRRIELDDDGGAGSLTGDYLAWQTFVIKDAAGNIIAESDFSPTNDTAFSASSDTLDAEALNISSEDITGSKIYRSTAGGTTKFPWIEVDGNVQTQSVSDTQTDAELSLVAAPTLGTAPNLGLVTSWRGRLWGVDRADVDDVRYSEVGMMYAWPAANSILVGRRGSDLRGVTALVPRREALGVGRRDSLSQITGNTSRDFRQVTLSERTGIESQETVKVFRDIAYFLGKDGVYSWSSEGIKCISDEGGVNTWFTSDSYFNRDRFQFAFAEIDPLGHIYRLYLANTGDSTENRWVEYHIETGKWWGPHKTGAFTPVSAGVHGDDNDLFIPLVASSTGYFWKEQETRTDDTATAIDMEVVTKRHDCGSPNIDKAFTRLRLLSHPETGGRLTVTPSLGRLDGVQIGTVGSFQADLLLESQELGRAGVGRYIQLTFQEASVGRNVKIYGYEQEFHELGRR